MKWFALAFVSVFFYEVQAQNVCLKLLENNLIIKSDTLHFKFSIQNNENNAFVLYNLSIPEYGMSFFVDSELKKGMPSLFVYIADKNNQLPEKIRTHTMPFRGSISEENAGNEIGMYQIIKPNETKECDVALDLWSIYLQKGTYKIQLKYFSNNYYNRSFRKAQKTNVNLKKYVMFKGVLKSNVVSFTIH